MHSSCTHYVLSCTLGCLVITATAWAGRPLTIDDAAPVAPWQVELEAGATYVPSGDLDHFDFPLGVALGLPGNLEVGVGFGGQLEEREDAVGQRNWESAIGDLTLGAKWQFLQADRFWADHALAGTLKLPTADSDDGCGSGHTDFDLTWIVTKPLGEKWNVHVNLGYTWVGGAKDSLHYGLAADYQLTDRIQLVAEVYADSPLNKDEKTAALAGGGVRWQVWESLVLDAALNARLSDAAPSWTATIGLTWTMDFNQKEGK